MERSDSDARATARVVALTGASRGIGAAIALELARRGFVVGCLSRKGIGVESLTVPPDLADRMIPVACDVVDEASLRAAFAVLADTKPAAWATFRLESATAGAFASGRTVLGKVQFEDCPWDCYEVSVPFAVKIP